MGDVSWGSIRVSAWSRKVGEPQSEQNLAVLISDAPQSLQIIWTPPLKPYGNPYVPTSD
jgi:hypothetical protein